ncbi:MAG: rhomboid family intramembrane serine protease [Candidatus Hermodarchaeota archaeon]
MTFCEFCGEQISFLPFHCKYCGGAFCKEHRLPEYHQCTFELKSVPTVPSNLRGTTTKSSRPRGTSRNFKKYMKRQDKQKQKTIKLYRSYDSQGTQKNATIYLLVIISVMSIASMVFPFELALNSMSFSGFYFWTFITSVFINFIYDFFGLIFLFILMIFFYMLIKNIEQTFGTNFLIQLYLICALFSGLIYFILWLMLKLFFIPPELIDYYPYGLASGALLGVICFTIYINWNRQMTFLIFFMPIRMKGKTIIAFLILIKLVPGLLFAIDSPPILLIYLPDLGGILASYIVYKYKFKNR